MTTAKAGVAATEEHHHDDDHHHRRQQQQQQQQQVVGRSLQTRQWKVPHYANPHHEFLTFTALVAGDNNSIDEKNVKKKRKNKNCSNNKKKELVVCWHGFPDTNHTFEPLLRHLTDESSETESSSSYIVIAPKLPGYQESSHLGRGQYTVLQVARQVIEFLRVLLQEYEEERLHLVGHDWGALIGSIVCQLQPHMIASFTNISMPNTRGRLPECVIQFPRQLLYSWYIFFFQLPLVPQYVLLYRNCALVQKLWNDWSPPPPPRTIPTPPPLLLPTKPVTTASRLQQEQDYIMLSKKKSSSSSSLSSLTYFLDLAKRQFQEGNNNNMSIVLLNALDYYRCNFRNVWLRRPTALTSHAFVLSGGGKQQQQQQQQQSAAAVPTLAIGGALDGCIMTNVFQASHHNHNSSSANKQDEYFGHLEMLVVGNAGHFVHLEQPEIVNCRIAALIKKFSASE